MQAVVPVASTLELDWVQRELNDRRIVCIPGNAREVLACADVAVVASGTATLEAALANVPFVVVYKLSRFSYAVGRRLIRGVEHIAMANLVAGEQVVPELIQEDASAGRIAEEVERYLGDPQHLSSVKQKLSLIRSQLRGNLDEGQSSSERVAEVLLQMCREVNVEE